MLSPAELALFLRVSASRVKPGLITHTRRLMESVAEDARDMIGRENPEWRPLAESTVRQKAALGFTGQVSATDPLLRTGALRASIQASTQATSDGAKGAVGSESEIALYQEMGTGRIPPRPFLATAMHKAEPRVGQEFGHFAQELLSPGIR